MCLFAGKTLISVSTLLTSSRRIVRVEDSKSGFYSFRVLVYGPCPWLTAAAQHAQFGPISKEPARSKGAEGSAAMASSNFCTRL